MSHQDKEDLRTPLQELNGVLQRIRDVDLGDVDRHGNATLNLFSVVAMALLTFGWSGKRPLGLRFESAHDATKRIVGTKRLAGSYQALMVALRSCGKRLCTAVCDHLLAELKTKANWKLYGRPTFAVDGSQFAVPRTKKNLARFAAASRKGKGAYKTDADYAKAKTTQIAVSLCLHLTSGLPLFWNFGGSSESERSLLLDMLERLPQRARLVMDAYYYGFKFWDKLISNGFTFVVRAGKNVDLLGELKLSGKVKCRGDLVLYWPQNAIDSGCDPIVLSLVTVMVGRKRMFLLTNELTLTEHQLADLYTRRWGVEVFFRCIKQSYERSKLLSRTPANAEQELQWTLLGIWMAFTLGGEQIPKGSRLSAVKVLRAICDLVRDVARQSVIKLSLANELAACIIADESKRKSGKNSDRYPRKKRKRPTGDPNVHPIEKDLRAAAIKIIL